MKHFIFFSFLFFTKVITAQNDLNTKKSSFNKAIIHFYDGTSISGIGRIKTSDETIIFKIEEKDKDEIWNAKIAKGITIVSDDGVIKDYVYLKLSKHSFNDLYEVITEGAITLYQKIIKSQISGGFSMPSTTTSMNHYGSESKEIIILCLKRKNEEFATKIKNNYIKTLTEYMKDCEYIVEKLKKQEYNSKTPKDLVDDYNSACGD